ncbi:MAG: thioredoxin family protein [Deltaproteobacteria bacterium]|nr:thioredoxin family protein [Deltaproteobacteria bacterium]MBW2072158.1 thioredoxin family protein [Deltaproteobacteria bacterium]
MTEKRKVEIFTAGCPVCQDVVDTARELACPDCELTIYDLSKKEGVKEAQAYKITALPAVAVNGRLLECCQRAPITREALTAAGVGKPL